MMITNLKQMLLLLLQSVIMNPSSFYAAADADERFPFSN